MVLYFVQRNSIYHILSEENNELYKTII